MISDSIVGFDKPLFRSIRPIAGFKPTQSTQPRRFFKATEGTLRFDRYGRVTESGTVQGTDDGHRQGVESRDHGPQLTDKRSDLRGRHLRDEDRCVTSEPLSKRSLGSKCAKYAFFLLYLFWLASIHIS